MSHNKPNNNHETVYTFDQRNDAVSDHTEAPSSITVRAEAAEILATLPNRISHVICWSAKERSDHPAVTDGATTLTYGELALLVENLAYTLKAFDIRAGDRVMIVSENSLHLVALLLATSEVDAWAVVVNPQLSEREINLIRAHSSARRVFYDGTTSTQAEAHAARNGATKEHIDQLGALWISPLNFAAMPEAVETHRSRQVAALMYTAGTTGNPKGVMLTHQNLLYAAAAYGLRCNTRPDDRVYGVLPMSHIIGISLILLGSLMAGATIEIVPRYDAATLAKSIADGSISILFGVPATYQRLLEHKAASGKAALSRGKLRRIAVAGAPLTTSLKQRIEAELGLSLSNGYGLTETSPSVTAVKSGRAVADDSVGPPIAGTELRVVDPNGQPVAQGVVGDLHVRGPGVMLGYYKAPDLTAAAIDPDGWFNTGDLAYLRDGNLYIVGRTKEMIIRSGFKVYPAEVEAVLDGHPDVVRSAVVGRAVDNNEEVVAFVQLLSGVRTDPSALAAHARGQLTPYKRPSEIVILDALPSGPTGKILKHKLLADAVPNRKVR